jgi:hypothetical protein
MFTLKRINEYGENRYIVRTELERRSYPSLAMAFAFINRLIDNELHNA